MSIFKAVTYGDIKYGNFVTSPDDEVSQEIIFRTNFLKFSSDLDDYNVLMTAISPEFYKLPFIEIPVTKGDFLHTVAKDYYGDEDYWHIIARFNNILDPDELDELTSVKVPIHTNLNSYIMANYTNR